MEQCCQPPINSGHTPDLRQNLSFLDAGSRHRTCSSLPVRTEFWLSCLHISPCLAAGASTESVDDALKYIPSDSSSWNGKMSISDPLGFPAVVVTLAVVSPVMVRVSPGHCSHNCRPRRPKRIDKELALPLYVTFMSQNVQSVQLHASTRHRTFCLSTNAWQAIRCTHVMRTGNTLGIPWHVKSNM